MSIEGGTLSSGSVQGGLSGPGPISGGQAGLGYGAGIFLQGTSGVPETLSFDPAAGQTVSIDDQIEDQNGASKTTNYVSYGLVMDGAGTLRLNVANAFTGGITLEQGTLELGELEAAGSGEISFDFDTSSGIAPPPVLKIDGDVVPDNLISGFASGASINVAGLPFADAHIVSIGSSSIVFSRDGGVFPETLNFTTIGAVTATAASDGSLLFTTAACYCRGTRILTEAGERPIEDLRIGDLVATAAGALRPVRWIGRRSYAGRFAQGNTDVMPIRIAVGALAEEVPKRDLFVSPQHSMFLDGLLIPAAALVNANSIARMTAVDQVEYFHLEFDTHDVILAEGALSESFVEDGNRGLFHNAADYAALHPELRPLHAVYFAPKIDSGAALEAVRRRLAARAAHLGPNRPGDAPAIRAAPTSL